MTIISTKNAFRILFGLLSVVILFHLLILVKIIPYEITWGGRLQSDREMYVFEGISIALNVFLIWMLSLKAKKVKNWFVSFVLWFFCVLFLLNTIGNLFAETLLEKSFSVLTLLSALLLLRILLKNKQAV
ncbi:hypothetical protein D3C87_95170 [compost metagenome]